MRQLRSGSLLVAAWLAAIACSNTGESPSGSGGGLGTGGAGGLIGSGGLAAGGTTSGGAPSGGGGPASGGAPSGGAASGGASGGGASSGGSGVGGAASGGMSHSVGVIPGTEHYNCDAPEGDMPEIQLTPYVTEGLELPIYLTHAPNETDRLFVIEQSGRILIVRDGVVEETPFLDISDHVSMDPWEQGLLGLAFHPDYSENGLFYVHYNSVDVAGHPDQANIIAEYHVSEGDPDVADATSERILLSVDTDRTGQYIGYHNGGSIFFGKDKELFIALGDGAGRGMGQASNNSQLLTTHRGKLLRINPLQSGQDPYSVPEGNIGAQGALPEIWSYGLRNPYRVNIDPCTLDIFIGDVGHFDWEEVDVEPGDSGGHNYGWPIYEGKACFNGAACTAPADYRAPFYDYPHSSGSGSVIGGSVYRGSAMPGLRGVYFFSDLYGGTRTFRYDSATDTITDIVSVEEQTNVEQEQQTLVAIQAGGDGELYFVARGGSTRPNPSPNDPPPAPSVIYKLEEYIP